MGVSLSCFASHQTISGQDKCRVVPILQFSSYIADPARLREHASKVRAARISWSTTVGWEPVGSFLSATANDYAGVTLEITPHTRRQMLMLLHHMLAHTPVIETDKESGEALFDLGAFVKAESDVLHSTLVASKFSPLGIGDEYDAALRKIFDYVWRGFSRHQLFIQDNAGRIQPLEFAVIHEDAFQTLLARRLTDTRHTLLPRDIRLAIKAAFDEAREEIDREDATFAAFARASSVADLLTSISDVTRRLYRVKHHLNRVAYDVFTDNLSVEQAIQLLFDDAADIFAFAATDDLGIAISPAIFAAEEDYHNDCGSAYLQFVSTVNRLATRGRKEVYFGKFMAYELLAAGKSDTERLVKAAKDWDCGLEVVNVGEPGEVVEDRLQVRVDSTLAMEDLQRLLADLDFPCKGSSVKRAG